MIGKNPSPLAKRIGEMSTEEFEAYLRRLGVLAIGVKEHASVWEARAIAEAGSVHGSGPDMLEALARVCEQLAGRLS